ncbi:hypothetical protein EDD28_2131 [Salana multivorans]|uniref:HicB-like protein involved in pilus formation n=1 Tax=Salana multivorans TaxID=120377 RepID=A0A3N2DCL4_9MICO|nr:hypothetical protein [Salana multivorans]ROR97531.1 hypothetical protein EDD28_2131 [Salana multivorans]
MSFDQRVLEVRDQLLALGSGAGGAVEEASGRLALALEPALRLALQRTLSDAADALREQLAEVATVEVRLEDGEPVIVAVPRVRVDPRDEDPAASHLPPTSVLPVMAPPFTTPPAQAAPEPVDEEVEAGVTRFTLRLPQHLKLRIDAAATGVGLSVNSWMVRAAELALTDTTPRSTQRAGNRLTGWIG